VIENQYFMKFSTTSPVGDDIEENEVADKTYAHSARIILLYQYLSAENSVQHP
jgi:hypothetical protein